MFCITTKAMNNSPFLLPTQLHILPTPPPPTQQHTFSSKVFKKKKKKSNLLFEYQNMTCLHQFCNQFFYYYKNYPNSFAHLCTTPIAVIHS